MPRFIHTRSVWYFEPVNVRVVDALRQTWAQGEAATANSSFSEREHIYNAKGELVEEPLGFAW